MIPNNFLCIWNYLERRMLDNILYVVGPNISITVEITTKLADLFKPTRQTNTHAVIDYIKNLLK